MIPKQSFNQLFENRSSDQLSESLVNRELLLLLNSETDNLDSAKVEHDSKIRIDNKYNILKIFDGSYQPSSILFRQKQEQDIQKFIDNCMSNKIKCRCLLLTGMPGAGKTLLSRRLLEKREDITVIALNGNVLHGFVDDMSMLIVGAKLPLPQLLDALKQKKREKKIFVCIDQFDSIFKRESSEILTIFQLFCNPVKNVSLIGTSNTMDIMNSLTNKYKLSLPDFQNIVFQPYSNQEIRNIIQSRLDEIKEKFQFTVTFEESALKYTAAKLSNTKGGDLRHAFGQIRAIIDQAMDDATSKTSCTVKFQHASKILVKLNKAIQGSELIQNLPFQYRMVLVALSLVYSRDQCLQASMKNLDKQITYIQKTLHLDCHPQRLSEMLKFLAVYGFMTTREKKKQIYICLKINQQSIKNALQDDQLLGRFFWQ